MRDAAPEHGPMCSLIPEDPDYCVCDVWPPEQSAAIGQPESSPQGQLGAALLALRERTPIAPLSLLHDWILGRVGTKEPQESPPQ